MKTTEEWITERFELRDPPYEYKELILAIQSDAFHAGKLSGLADALVIVQKHDEPADGVESMNCHYAAEELEAICESLEKK